MVTIIYLKIRVITKSEDHIQDSLLRQIKLNYETFYYFLIFEFMKLSLHCQISFMQLGVRKKFNH
jgi:hypothetical protein